MTTEKSNNAVSLKMKRETKSAIGTVVLCAMSWWSQSNGQDVFAGLYLALAVVMLVGFAPLGRWLDDRE